MNLRWLKDFIAVAELGSFSRAAESRAITQPAMSRHIKGLEDQLGFQLIDRSIFPATLTTAGQKFYALSLTMLEEFDQGVSEILKQSESDAGVIRFAMQHVLASDFFTRWWQQQSPSQNLQKVAVEADNLHDCVQKLEDGHIHFMMCYQPGEETLDLNQDLYASKKIGADILVPVSAISDSAPKFSLEPNTSVPLACSGSTDFMGKVVDSLIERNQDAPSFVRIYEDSFSEGVRSQVIAGTGLGWLPMMLVQRDLDAGRLMIVGEERWRQNLTIHLYVRHDRLNEAVRSLWNKI
ncbi:MAG: LysR family transcriptional regulator [Granulosicoccus sp.]|nr:LysR family transcriptional regulator [Granulosicoccus sp.]